MQSLPISQPKMTEKLLSPIPIRNGPIFLSNKPKNLSKSIDFHRKKPYFMSKNEDFNLRNAIHLSSKTNSSEDPEDKAEKGLFIDEKDLNGLILLREDSRNPQEKDLCFRCINFDDIEAVKLDLTEAFGNL